MSRSLRLSCGTLSRRVVRETTGHGPVAASRPGHSAGGRHERLVHCLHPRTGFQPGSEDHLCNDHRRRADTRSDFPDTDCHSADECRSAAARPRCRSIFRHRRHWLDGRTNAYRILCKTQQRSEGVSGCNRMCGPADSSFCCLVIWLRLQEIHTRH